MFFNDIFQKQNILDKLMNHNIGYKYLCLNENPVFFSKGQVSTDKKRNKTAGMAIYHYLGLLCCFSAGKKILSDINSSSIILKKWPKKKNNLIKKENIGQCITDIFHSINNKCVLFVVSLYLSDKKLEPKYDTICWQTLYNLKFFYYIGRS